MIAYILLTAIANVFLSYYLLNADEPNGAYEYADKKGLLRFYIVSALFGPAIIPIVAAYVIYVMLIKK